MGSTAGAREHAASAKKARGVPAVWTLAQFGPRNSSSAGYPEGGDANRVERRNGGTAHTGCAKKPEFDSLHGRGLAEVRVGPWGPTISKYGLAGWNYVYWQRTRVSPHVWAVGWFARRGGWCLTPGGRVRYK